MPVEVGAPEEQGPAQPKEGFAPQQRKGLPRREQALHPGGEGEKGVTRG